MMMTEEEHILWNLLWCVVYRPIPDFGLTLTLAGEMEFDRLGNLDDPKNPGPGIEIYDSWVYCR